MAMMTRAFRDEWLKRCTDGSFTQTQSVLAEPDNPKERCCLGVAIAVGEELKLLEPGRLEVKRDEETLLPSERDALGITSSEQDAFISANNYNTPAEGEYYPNKVIKLIKVHPVID